MQPIDPKITRELKDHVGPALKGITRACQKMRNMKVQPDDDVLWRAAWARNALLELQNALIQQDSLNNPHDLFNLP